jgi:hypothetical protein
MNYAEFYRYDSGSGLLFRAERPRKDFMHEWSFRMHIDNCKRPIGVKVYRTGGFPIGVFVNPSKSKKRVCPKDTLAHRIIWKLVHGDIPEGMVIDHINGNPFDNRLHNLRLVTHTENCRNARSHTTNSTRLKGIAWDKKNAKWQTEIRTPVGRVFLGRHRTKGEAALAYAKASLRYHGRHSIYARTVPRIGVPKEDLDRMREKGYSE